VFDVQHAKLVTETNRLLEDAKKKLANANKEEKEDCEKWVEEFKARLDCLKEQINAYETTPLVYDCIWFNDGNVWRAVIDTEFSGDLSKYQPLAEYSLEKQYSCFGIDSMLTFSVNFYDEGSVLSIVTTSGTCYNSFSAFKFWFMLWRKSPPSV
jgi:tripeptidyl-peptidase-2